MSEPLPPPPLETNEIKYRLITPWIERIQWVTGSTGFYSLYELEKAVEFAREHGDGERKRIAIQKGPSDFGDGFIIGPSYLRVVSKNCTEAVSIEDPEDEY